MVNVNHTGTFDPLHFFQQKQQRTTEKSNKEVSSAVEKKESTDKTEGKSYNVENKVAATFSNTQKAGNSSETMGGVKLSKAAQDLLKKLKDKYGNMDFFVADYSNANQAQQIMSRSTKEYSVLIDPEELEKMAQDEDYAAQQMSALDGAVNMAEQIKEQYGFEAALEEEGDSSFVSKFGITIGSDGKAEIFVTLEELSEKQKERIQAQREKNAEEDKTQEKTEPSDRNLPGKTDSSFGRKKTQITGNSLEEILQKISQVDWSKVKEERTEQASFLDFRA